MGRKLFCLLFVFSLLIAPFGTSVLASNDSVAPSKEMKERVSSAFDKAVSKGKDGKFHIDGMTVHLDLDYVVADKENDKVSIKEEKPATTMRLKLEGATIAHGIIFIPPERENNSYPGDGYVFTLFELVDTDGPVGPVSIVGEVDVDTTNWKFGNLYEDFSNVQVDWDYFEINDGKRAFSFTKVEDTNFYHVETEVTIEFLFDQDSASETWEPLLANKKAFEYPCRYFDPKETWIPGQCHGGDSTGQVLYQDPYSDKVMFTPLTTELQQVPPEERVPWDNQLRGEYIKEYIETYGDPRKKDSDFRWSDYDIHHIIPREYGGTNSFLNLIPLKREFHQQNVTPWWTNY